MRLSEQLLFTTGFIVWTVISFCFAVFVAILIARFVHWLGL